MTSVTQSCRLGAVANGQPPAMFSSQLILFQLADGPLLPPVLLEEERGEQPQLQIASPCPHGAYKAPSGHGGLGEGQVMNEQLTCFALLHCCTSRHTVCPERCSDLSSAPDCFTPRCPGRCNCSEHHSGQIMYNEQRECNRTEHAAHSRDGLPCVLDMVHGPSFGDCHARVSGVIVCVCMCAHHQTCLPNKHLGVCLEN